MRFNDRLQWQMTTQDRIDRIQDAIEAYETLHDLMKNGKWKILGRQQRMRFNEPLAMADDYPRANR
jgi:hypothetical protein